MKRTYYIGTKHLPYCARCGDPAKQVVRKCKQCGAVFEVKRERVSGMTDTAVERWFEGEAERWK